MTRSGQATANVLVSGTTRRMMRAKKRTQLKRRPRGIETAIVGGESVCLVAVRLLMRMSLRLAQMTCTPATVPSLHSILAVCESPVVVATCLLAKSLQSSRRNLLFCTFTHSQYLPKWLSAYNSYRKTRFEFRKIAVALLRLAATL
jgi:hypothetical protein